jgi:hypothetical protein
MPGAQDLRIKNTHMGRSHLRTRWILFLLGVLIIYLSNGRGLGSYDNVALRYLPLSIIREGNFDLNEFPFLYTHGVMLYPIVYQDGHFLSFAPIAPALLAVPFYLLPSLAGIAAESPWMPQVEKLAAAGIAALSVVFMYLTLARLVPVQVAFLAASLYAFGTTTFGLSSQSLMPVGSAQLLLAVGLYLLIRGRTDPRWTPYAALPLSWAVLCRPSSALIGFFIAVYVLRHQRHEFLRFMLLALPAVAFQLVYNKVYFGTPFLPPGYVSTGGHVLARPENFNAPLIRGLTGLLVSPATGFFVYSPVFILSVVGFYRRWRKQDPLALYLAVAALGIILLDSKLNMWWGGMFMGPRYVVEIAPLLTYFLAFGIRLSAAIWRKFLFAILVAWSIYANGLVAFVFDGSWDRGANLWSWANSPIVYYSRHGLDLLRGLDPALLRWVKRLPDSRTPGGLVADLQVEGIPSRLATMAFFHVTVDVQNIGSVVWLRQSPSGGTVKFGWRWVRQVGRSGELAAGGPVLPSELEGRGPVLATDILPGSQVKFVASILAPPEPGVYQLELGMVSENVAWFSGDMWMPIRVSIEVVGESTCPFERALTVMADDREPPLHVQLVADSTVLKADEVFSARLNIANLGPARVLYPAIVLRWPSDKYSFIDLDQQTFQSICPGWLEQKWPMFLDQGYQTVEHPLLTLLLTEMPSGRYTLYYLYLRPEESALRLVAATALSFERLP